MSEYQYYEFLTIDRQLTPKHMAELRSCSTRATITQTGFVNEYHWGDLKGDPADWMRRYFDAFVYVANWCSCRLMLRVPLEVFQHTDLRQFGVRYVLDFHRAGQHCIVDWSLEGNENHERFVSEDGRSWMGRLTPLRTELLRGDLRSLYLGWLAGAASGDVQDTAIEPDVPAGLSRHSGAQQALVEFLEIDPDLLTAAAAGSAEEWRDDDSAGGWLASLSKDAMLSTFQLLLHGESQEAERRVKADFFAWQSETWGIEAKSAKRRSLAELRSLAEKARKLRLEREAKALARKEAAQRKKRAAYLRALAADFIKHWNSVDALA